MKSNSSEDLIKNNMDLVHRIAHKVYMNIPPGLIDKEDLINEGFIGLIKASNKFNASINDNFEAYARIRIKGAMIDYLRKQDILPQQKRSEIKKFEKNLFQLENKLGRSATEEEIIENLNITSEEYRNILENINISTYVYLDSCSYDFLNSNLIYKESFETSTKTEELLLMALDALSEQEKMVLNLYYYEDLNFKEIADILNVSKARVSQIHSKSIMRLRGKLSRFKKDL